MTRGVCRDKDVNHNNGGERRYQELLKIVELDPTLDPLEEKALREIYSENCDIFQLPSDGIPFQLPLSKNWGIGLDGGGIRCN